MGKTPPPFTNNKGNTVRDQQTALYDLSKHNYSEPVQPFSIYMIWRLGEGVKQEKVNYLLLQLKNN